MGRRRKSVIPGFSWNRALGITSAKQRFARATGIPTTKQGRKRKLQRTLWSAVAVGVAASLSSSGAKSASSSSSQASSGPRYRSWVLKFLGGILLLTCGVNLLLAMLRSSHSSFLLMCCASIIGGSYLCTSAILTLIDNIKLLSRSSSGDPGTGANLDAPAPPCDTEHEMCLPDDKG